MNSPLSPVVRDLRPASDNWRWYRMFRASSVEVARSNPSSDTSNEALFVLSLITEAKNCTAPVPSMQRLLVSFVEAIDLSLLRHFICVCGDLASLISLTIWALLTGGFGVGNLSMPFDALRVHHDWINRRRVWFGVSSVYERTCLVAGHVLFFPENIHFSMLSRSYVIPVETVTGSFIISREMGQMKNGGTSTSAIGKTQENQDSKP